ncbi:MAG TPA: LytR C-terminal domain-containing protein [Actinokineospora sp.]|jgi:hypothetical protein|nr:LytR C-terminal domain-containing protein [Actinokineospora sp.]
MTTDPSSVRTGRVAGIALIGVAAVATVIGVITLLGGNGDSAANQNPSSAAPATTTSAEAPSTSTSQDPTSAPVTSSAAPTTTTAAPAPTTTAAPTPAPAPSNKDQPVRVYNNSLETGLAKKAAEDLAEHGWQVAETSNYPQGIIPTTTVYYRPATAEETAARELAQAFGIRVEERFEGLKQASPGLILIVTKDYHSPSIDK